ncbi:hypothetical protein ACOSQ3_017539 [Xanthoceras sorbifolium]
MSYIACRVELRRLEGRQVVTYTLLHTCDKHIISRDRPQRILCQTAENSPEDLACKKLELGLYKLFKTRTTNELEKQMSLHHCFARRALLKRLKSRKPRSPSNLLRHNDSRNTNEFFILHHCSPTRI